MTDTDKSKDYVNWFRNSAPYINANRNKTLVLMLGGEALAHAGFIDIIHDIALLNSLGLRLVIVHGARPQIEQRLTEKGISSEIADDLRITDQATLACVKEAAGALRTELEALLSMGLANSPMHGAKLRICSGNFVSAKPLGVRGGVDFCHTGEVRKIDCAGMRRQLDDGCIVLLSPLGYSPTGEIFNLSAEDLATETAIALNADKLVLMCQGPGVVDNAGKLVREINTQDAESLVASQPLDIQRHIAAACDACQAGIERTHLVSYQEDGALLTELFTRDGAGTLITVKSYEQVRSAAITDVGGIIELIRPLEKQGVLVRRSRELLESEIERFTVIERDGSIIGCAALYPFDDEQAAELACVAVHPDYRNHSRGDRLLDEVSRKAQMLGISQLLVLTTQTAHWFQERGFEKVSVESLPESKQALYNYQRNSNVFVKAL